MDLCGRRALRRSGFCPPRILRAMDERHGARRCHASSCPPSLTGEQYCRTCLHQMWREDARQHLICAAIFGQPPPDSEFARRAVIVLEDYLSICGRREVSMRADSASIPRKEQQLRAYSADEIGQDEVLEVLGLRDRGFSWTLVRAAHRRLVQLAHPDLGDSLILRAKSTKPRTCSWPRRCAGTPAQRRNAHTSERDESDTRAMGPAASRRPLRDADHTEDKEGLRDERDG